MAKRCLSTTTASSWSSQSSIAIRSFREKTCVVHYECPFSNERIVVVSQQQTEETTVANALNEYKILTDLLLATDCVTGYVAITPKGSNNVVRVIRRDGQVMEIVPVTDHNKPTRYMVHVYAKFEGSSENAYITRTTIGELDLTEMIQTWARG